MTRALFLTLALSASALTISAHGAEQNSGPNYIVTAIEDRLPNSDLYHAEVVDLRTRETMTVILSTKDVVFVAPGIFAIRPGLRFQDL